MLSLLAAGCSSLPGSDTPEPTAPDAKLAELTLPDGSKQYMPPAEFAHTGKGTLRTPDGRTLTGTFKEGLLQGFGHEETREESYTGQWLDGARHGRGELTRAGDFRYEGGFANNLPHGQGVQRSPGGTYRGGFAEGLFAGQGTLTTPRGSAYQGFWQAGQRSGFGQETRADGSRYQGDWLADQPHGFGERLYGNRSTYEGAWEAGMRHGYGRFNSPAGIMYEGLWELDKRHGYGKQMQPNGSYYEGNWQADLQDGSGIAVRPDGSQHAGTWSQGFILGTGTRTNRSGVIYSGNWNRNTITDGLLELPSGAQYGGPLFRNQGRSVSTQLLAWMQAQSSNQDPHAQYLLATAFLDFDDPVPDPATAQIWLYKAADAGHAEAQYRLFTSLEDSDISGAIAWLQQAAQSGHPEANQRLAQFYHMGHHFQQDLTTAIRLYEQAMAQGSIDATNNLAWLLATSLNTELADPERAVELIQPFVFLLGDANHLDTLAAAHARLGNMELAQQMQHQALDKAQADALADSIMAEMKDRLTLYEANTPYLE
ncbi:MAG: hypothetical protein AAF993_06505 [Pseudomonadota bacterium]